MIEVEGLTKWYGRRLALDGISFQVGRGEIVGFLGPNGAGKSTTLRILTGFLPATSGRARVGGHDVFAESLAVRASIGYMPENVPLYTEMRVQEYLAFRAGLKGLGGKDRGAAVDRVVERCWLQERRRSLIGSLSKGFRQRVGLAEALISDPPVLILDEPTIGLDPSQIQETRRLIQSLGQKHTVLLSSHILPEVEKTCSHLVIIAEGRIVAEGSVEELRRGLSARHRVILEAKGEGPAEMARALGQIQDATSVDREDLADGWVQFTVVPSGTKDLREAVAALAIERKWRVRDVHRQAPTLEDMYMAVIAGTGDAARHVA
jgi:ABC-2 type transport system ATP-binding protein